MPELCICGHSEAEHYSSEGKLRCFFPIGAKKICPCLELRYTSKDKMTYEEIVDLIRRLFPSTDTLLKAHIALPTICEMAVSYLWTEQKPETDDSKAFRLQYIHLHTKGMFNLKD